MSNNFFVIFNNTTDKNLGINAIKRPDIPVAERNITQITIEGRDGSLTKDDGTYKNIEIIVEYNFMDRLDFNSKSRIIKSWITNIKDNTLQFSDDLDFFYKVKYCRVDVINRVKKIKGTFKVTFICEPYSFLKDGLNEILNPSFIYNDSFIIAKPTIKVIGEGYVTLTINNKSVEINVGQELLIDTDLEICFKEGVPNNISFEKGWYNYLYLLEGENTIDWTNKDSIDVVVIPRFKTI